MPLRPLAGENATREFDLNRPGSDGASMKAGAVQYHENDAVDVAGVPAATVVVVMRGVPPRSKMAAPSESSCGAGANRPRPVAPDR